MKKNYFLFLKIFIYLNFYLYIFYLLYIYKENGHKSLLPLNEEDIFWKCPFSGGKNEKY